MAGLASRLSLAALAALLILTILGPPLGGLLWIMDLVANLAAQASLIAIGALGLGAWIGFRGRGRGPVRRWWLAMLASIALLVQGAVLIPGRSVWVDRAPAKQQGPGTIRVLAFNAFSENTTPRRAIELVERSGADVVVLLEQRRKYALESEAIGERYPSIEISRPIDGRAPWMLVISRWPARSMGQAEGFAQTPGCLPVLIESPMGSFGVVAIHAQSPRGSTPWRRGNESVRAAADAVERFEQMGVAAIVVGDLNGTPGGWRSRWLGRTSGLARLKPVLSATGTWPAKSPWPLSVAIDDVWAPRGWRCTGWETIGAPDYGGSDHRAVLVEILPDGGLASAAEPGNDQPG